MDSMDNNAMTVINLVGIKVTCTRCSYAVACYFISALAQLDEMVTFSDHEAHQFPALPKVAGSFSTAQHELKRVGLALHTFKKSR